MAAASLVNSGKGWRPGEMLPQKKLNSNGLYHLATGLECHEDVSTNPENANRHNKPYLFVGDRSQCSPTQKLELVENNESRKGVAMRRKYY
uniref:OSJNBb0066J23.2 protein n=1 Tax=Oryza sativa subsp. japonica TaxID=39947 RepID=Q7X6N3_ORYSJ|nr:OSJNBb0066J23.2 [Oryza sativa Japonica Group]